MGETAAAPTSWLARLLMWPVRVYQLVRADRPSPCRHVPSCSTYALEALESHGPAKGTWLGMRRLLRCHPWGTSGYDPVPERKAN
jgi:putative membrane protein insertion efficiency factor